MISTIDFAHLSFDPYILYKCQRLASTASKREGAKYHRKNGLLMINSKKRGCQDGWGQENHSVSKLLAIFVIFEVKEAVEVIEAVEAVEVILPDGANEATEVVRFT